MGRRGLAVLRAASGDRADGVGRWPGSRRPTALPATGLPAEVPTGRGFRHWLDRKAWRDAIIAIPYLWLLLFFLAALPHHPRDQLSAQATIAMPPVQFNAELALCHLRQLSAARLRTRSMSRGYLNSLLYAAIATFLCLLIGYPMALGDRPRRGRLAQHPAAAGHPAVLDLVPAARLCLDRPARQQQLVQPRPYLRSTTTLFHSGSDVHASR